MKKAEVKPDEELANAVETLEQITNEWLEQQRSRFENTTPTLQEKRIPDCYVLRSFKNTMCKRRRFDETLYGFHLYILTIAKSLPKKIWKHIIVRSIEFMLKVEKY